MQNNDPSRAKTYDFEAFKESALPLKEHFYEVESNKFLLGYRHIWVSLMLRILLAAILSFGVPIYLVLIWFVASLICNYYIGRESKMFTTLLFAKPMFMTEQMKRCVKNFKCTWHVNAIVWGSSGILAQIWLSDIARVLSLTTLTAVVYLFLTRNCANKKLMHEVSFLILGIPFIAATCRIILSDPTSQSLLLFSGHAFHISLTAFMVVLIGGRLNKSFKQHCVAEYAQLKLI